MSIGVSVTVALIASLTLLEVPSCKGGNATVAILVIASHADKSVEPDWTAGPAVIPAVKLAVDRINNRTDVLPDHNILLLEGVSGCQQESYSTFGFVSEIFHAPTSVSVVGVIGPACSESAIVLGKLVAKDGISLIQISPTATSPVLNDADKYLNTFRMLSPSIFHANVVIQLIMHNDWKDIAVLYSLSLVDAFLNILPYEVGFISEIHSTNYPLENIIEQFKVIVLIAETKHILQTLCLAYHHQPQVVYPIYQWIIVDELPLISSVEFTYHGEFYNCPQDIMAQAIEGSIFTSYPLQDARENKSKPTDVDITVEQYQEMYREYHNKHVEDLDKFQRNLMCDLSANAEDYSISYYDATWALVLALNASLDSLPSLTEYKYGQPVTTRIIRQQLSQLVFEGLMGRIAFQDSHAPKPFLRITQYIACENIHIGTFKGKTLNIFNGKAHFVEDTFHRQFVGVHVAATALISLIFTIVAVYTAFLHIFYILFQNHKSIKATSFRMSHFMFSGCYLILMIVFLHTVGYSYEWHTQGEAESRIRDITFGMVCNVREWSQSIGISLIMSTLCGKLWRIYRIFSHFSTHRFLISDLTLTIFIIAVVTVNMVVFVLWTTIDPLFAVYEQQGIRYDGQHEAVILERAYCHCSYYSVWISLVYAVILSLVTCTVVLSLLNRRVHRTYFKTAKWVNMMIYLLALSCFLGFVSAFIFEEHNIHYAYILRQLSLLSIVSLVDLFLFSPPVFRVIK